MFFECLLWKEIEMIATYFIWCGLELVARDFRDFGGHFNVESFPGVQSLCNIPDQLMLACEY